MEEIQTKSLEAILWDGANVLRGKMDANEYKDYLLALVFYKYLSDKIVADGCALWSADRPSDGEAALKTYREAYGNPDFRNELEKEDRYLLSPELTFSALADAAAEGTFQRETLGKAFNQIEGSDPMFQGLFKNVDLYSRNLGETGQKQTDTLAQVMAAIAPADFLRHSGDVLGDAYEYLIGQFASETGKKAGEFYTPKAVAEILARIAIEGQESREGLSVYDAAMGSGSLLLDARKFVKGKTPEETKALAMKVRYYGQEIIPTTYNLARMNMVLHGVPAACQHLHLGDTLDADWPQGEDNVFDMVVMNPPYSLHRKLGKGFLSDPRFQAYGVLPPASKADYAFLLHGFYHLKDTGTMAIVLPHGVLFRGNAEAQIRQRLVENGSIYAVIGLPANLFHNTSIPTIVMVLRKRRDDSGDSRSILFVDASKEFERGKNQNRLTPENIEAIMKMYRERKDVDKHAHLASFEEIKKNGFNLNIPRYVDSFEAEPEVDIAAVAQDIRKDEAEAGELKASLRAAAADLTASDAEGNAAIKALLSLLE